MDSQSFPPVVLLEIVANLQKATALGTMWVPYYEKNDADSRLSVFQLIAYYILFYANFKFTQLPGYIQNNW